MVLFYGLNEFRRSTCHILDFDGCNYAIDRLGLIFIRCVMLHVGILGT
jgi:hypothetical protein